VLVGRAAVGGVKVRGSLRKGFNLCCSFTILLLDSA
jgi:hypothetical protein